MAERKTLEPQITVTGKDSSGQPIEQIVKVGSLSWGAIKTLLDEIASVNLPLPNLAGGAVSAWISATQEGYASIDPHEPAEVTAAKLAIANQQSTLGLYRVVADLLTENLQVLYQWLLKHPPIASALVRGATGLTEEQIDSLSAGQFLRVTRASWNALVEDGFMEELTGFFGDLIPATKPPESEGETQTANPSSESSAPAATPGSASESKSASAPSPAGV